MIKPKIREVRESRGLKQGWVAEQVGVNRNMLGRWERGESYPGADRLWKLCKVLGCKFEDLYEEE